MAHAKAVESDMLHIQNQLKAALRSHQVIFSKYFFPTSKIRAESTDFVCMPITILGAKLIEILYSNCSHNPLSTRSAKYLKQCLLT
jgi:hypothetical protein